mgnify:CR=1 FL=1
MQWTTSFFIAALVLGLSTGCTQNTSDNQREQPLASEASEDSLPKPQPELPPKEVVVIQLEQLMANAQGQEKKTGYQVMYRFMGEDFREMVGGWDGFVGMMEAPTHAPMREFTDYKIREHFREDGKAEYFVSLRQPEDDPQYLQFQLKKAGRGDYEGSWLIHMIAPMQGDPNDNPHQEDATEV